MRTTFWIGITLGLILWAIFLQRQLAAARRRGDMYRDAATRMERRIDDLTRSQSS
ncbi:MAG: hypothetical protein HXY39_04810 [Chloroflexi bacterium]|nr:hypothetical protein [Chloroflexota bacterium]